MQHSTGQYCNDKYSESSGVFIGTQKLKPAAFVDDLIDPNRTVSDIIEPNENAKHFEKIKRLTFKADKCKSLYRVSQKKYTSMKSHIVVLRTNKSLTFVSFVTQDLNLNFET